MTSLLGVPLTALVPVALGVYALAFIAGGIYYMEQRVARVRDQFPRRGVLLKIVGFAALGIGLLAAISLVGHFVFPAGDARMGALVAVVAGVAFWVHHLHIDLTLRERVRDSLLSLLCAGLSVLTYWWALTA
jgi:hypothetical protein